MRLGSIILSMWLFFPWVAQAAPIEVGRVADGQEVRDSQLGFGINLNLGRAWVSVERESGQGDSSSLYNIEFLVKGLSYSSATIWLGSTPCAQVQFVGIGAGTPYIYPTGRCYLHAQSSDQPVDDGFRISNRQYYLITVDVH
jgi:hypothetical protein